MREAAGFRLGPFELMDLTALDVSHPVMESIYRQFYDEPRFRPSVITAQRLAGGRLGRKTKGGFYDYADDAAPDAEPPAPIALPASVWISRTHVAAHGELTWMLERMGATVEAGPAPSDDALIVVTPLGVDATTTAIDEGLDPERTVAIDTLVPLALRRTLMTTPVTRPEVRDEAHGLFASDGVAVTCIGDSPGFIAQRILATDRQHRVRHRAAGHRDAGRHRPRGAARAQLSERPARDGRRARPDEAADDPARDAGVLRRPALSPVAVADATRPARRVADDAGALTMGAELLVERRDRTLVLTFSNPAARNALGPEIYEPAMKAFDDVAGDASVRAVVLTGAGGTFCAGGNLHRLLDNRSKPPQVQAESIEGLHRLTRAITGCAKPVIAAVEGAAAGAGMSLALACDLIVAARSAKFVMSYVRVGLSPDGGGSWFATRALPRQSAAELLLEGGAWTAERLHALGVVNAVVDDGAALATALDHADRIAALSPHAVARIKRLVAGAAVAPLEDHLDAERDAFVACLHHRDGGEAVSAFLEKRKPSFD